MLEAKLAGLTLHDRVHTAVLPPDDLPGRMLRVDFPTRTVEEVDGLSDGDFYSMTAPSWEVARVLDGKITWDDFSLTFRCGSNREPDIYHTVVQGFLRLEPEDMNWFCERLLRIETNQERIVVECNGTRYAVDRYCPHQGGDLRRAWVEEGGSSPVRVTSGSSTWKTMERRGATSGASMQSVSTTIEEPVAPTPKRGFEG